MVNRSLSTVVRVFVFATAAATLALCSPPHAQDQSPLRFGMVTDIHYADIDDAGSRHYRESADRLAEFVRVMNQEQVDFVIELGDFKDQDKEPNQERTLGYLRHIESVFAGFAGPRFHVLGNHDMDSISKQQYLQTVRNMNWNGQGELAPHPFVEGLHSTFPRYSVSVDSGPPITLIVLDANHRSDGSDYGQGNFAWDDTNLGVVGLQALDTTLAATVAAGHQAIVFVHQQLDGEGTYYVKDAADARKLLEASGCVLAVFQGHRHEGGFSVINGIPYYTLRAVAEGAGNAFAIVTVDWDDTVSVAGFGRAESKRFRATALRER